MITVQPLDPEVAEAFQFFDTNDTKTIDKATFKKMVYSLGDLPLPVRCETVHRVAPCLETFVFRSVTHLR